MWCILRNPNPAHVNVSAAAFLVWENNLNSFSRFSVFLILVVKEKSNVICVYDCNISFSGCYSFYLILVCTFWITSHIGYNTFCPLFSLFLAIVNDDRSQ